MQVVVLLASELVSNAVRHADAAWIPVRVEVTTTHVRVEVFDDGPRFEGRALPPQQASQGGWGLHLVDELSSRWGVSMLEAKSVWFEIDR